MMKATEFYMPEVLLQGPKCLSLLGKELKRLGKNKALLVTDKFMEKAGYAEKVGKILEEAGCSFSVFSDIGGEPGDKDVVAGLEAYRKNGCEFLVALGGGSPIDAAKAIGILETNGGKITDYMGAGKVQKPTLPLIAIATTAGTGSEMTKVTIINDTANDVKMLISSPWIIPTIAVADPELTRSMPPGVTAATGLDAFCHAIEAFVSKREQPITDVVALKAIRLISENLRKAWCDGDDMEARANMTLAATLGGIAFNNSSVTLIHGMSRPIGALFHIAHGISNAVLLPVWAEFTYVAKPEKFAEVAAVMGENVNGLSTLQAARKAVDAIVALCGDVEIPPIRTLIPDRAEFEKHLGKMAHDALVSGSPGNNPRFVTEEKIIELYKKAY
ncbi:MAG: iron-containing alcohol dehydrogenase [Synergistaceae bacterium]|jgi:alcohol dehydrogenase class IV|nr:iron-containing alcohol dehydrogenase [Synergistaceae bacterium]